MDSPEELKDQVVEATNLKTDDIIFMYAVKKIDSHGKTKKRLLVITSNCLYMVNKRPARRALKVSVRFGFESIKSIEKDTKGQIVIKCSRDLKFFELEPNSIVVPIIEHLVTIFTQDELPELPILEYIKTEIKAKPNAAFWRLKYKAYLSQKSDFVTVELRQLMNLAQTFSTLNFSIFYKFPQLFDEILDSLLVLSNIQEIIVQYCFPSWVALSKFFTRNKTVVSLETSQPIDNTFIKFAQAYSINKDSPLTSLTFCNNEYGKKFTEGLKLLLKPNKITSLSIRNGLTQEGYQSISPLIIDYDGFQAVNYFDISGCKFVNPEFVMIQLTNLTTLIINDCSVDICSLLEDLTKNKHIRLTELHCSDSFCSDKLDTSYVLSQKINFVVFDNNSWQGNSLSKFLHILSNPGSSTNITLSIRDAQMSTPDWKAHDYFLQSFFTNNIVALDYSGNKIQKGFCNFLNKSPKLTKLTVSRCFTRNESNFEVFCEYLSQNKCIEILDISGNDTYYLGPSIGYLFKALKMTHFLHVLDISHNMIGNQVLSFIFDFITSNPNMMEIMFDSNNINDPQMLKQFVAKVSELKRKINVRLPLNDMSKMVDQGKMSEAEVNELKEQLFGSDYLQNPQLDLVRERNNSLRMKSPPFRTPLTTTTNSTRLRNSTFISGGMSQPARSPLGTYQMRKLGQLASMDSFSTHSSSNGSPFNIRSISANSLNNLGMSNTMTSTNASDSSSIEHSDSKKRRPRRSSDIIFKENKNTVPFEEQLKFNYIKDEYISDVQWISFLNDIPEVNLENIGTNLEKQFSLLKLMESLK